MKALNPEEIQEKTEKLKNLGIDTIDQNSGGMFGKGMSMLSDPKAALKGAVPEEYSGYMDKMEAGLEMAQELKKKKDQL